MYEQTVTLKPTIMPYMHYYFFTWFPFIQQNGCSESAGNRCNIEPCGVKKDTVRLSHTDTNNPSVTQH